MNVHSFFVHFEPASPASRAELRLARLTPRQITRRVLAAWAAVLMVVVGTLAGFAAMVISFGFP